MLRNFFAILTLLAWGLWFGALAGLVLFVITLFHIDRSQAVRLAPQMFRVFERAELLVAAVTLCGVVGWWAVQRSPALLGAFALLGLAAIGAAISAGHITPTMIHMADAGKSSGAEFTALHATSEALYKAVFTALLVAGGMFATLATPTKTPAAAK